MSSKSDDSSYSDSSSATEIVDSATNGPKESDDQGQNRQGRRKKRKQKEHAPGYYDELVWNLPDKEAYKGPRINWATLSNRKWAKETLFKHMPHAEVSNLVGWAHHVTHNGERTDLPANPLLEAQPDSPLPQSHLDFLQEKARDLVRGKPNNPNVSRAKVMDESLECILDKFDTSAAVSLGVVLEEMITANLLPLAEVHVHRCRQLEQEEEDLEKKLEAEDDHLPTNYEAPSFREWTLPPEEAIFNAIVSSPSADGNRGPESVNLPSTCPPVRTIVAENEMTRDPAEQAATNFCQRQGLQTRFVRKNMDIFQWYLASAPPVGDDHRPKKRRQYRKRGQAAQKKSS